jgi:hypothetical protein
MKKIIITEEQIKQIVNNLLMEEEDNNFIKTVQEFLNTVLKLNPPLIIDGLTGTGSKTEKAIMKYQQLIKVWPVDGIWGEDTMNKMPEKHKQYFEKIKQKNMSGFDKIINKITT